MRILSKQTPPPRSTSYLRIGLLFVSVAGLLGLAGCGEQAQISEYTLPKEANNPSKPAPPASNGPKVPTRMLAAMVSK
ncbi:MAG: hypothetical protein KDA84_04870, partial [Planctomycetaceae bacterium]|nr:hypothetical protein [Planctomycetaceae bacterium]